MQTFKEKTIERHAEETCVLNSSNLFVELSLLPSLFPLLKLLDESDESGMLWHGTDPPAREFLARHGTGILGPTKWMARHGTAQRWHGTAAARHGYGAEARHGHR